MKKVILSVAAVALAVVVFSSCKPDEKEKTNEELLTNPKGWVMTRAISNPAYTNSLDYTDADLFKSWFYPCELKDILAFKSDKEGKKTILTSTCDAGIKQTETLGTWSFKKDTKDEIVLNFRIPFFEENIMADVRVTKLDENSFEFSYTWTEEGSGKDYKFTITYVPGK